jgi:hypothetical protein
LSKIEVGYSKRKIVCIHFGCSLKKNRLGQSSLWKAAMAELKLHDRQWELTGEKGGEE